METQEPTGTAQDEGEWEYEQPEGMSGNGAEGEEDVVDAAGQVYEDEGEEGRSIEDLAETEDLEPEPPPIEGTTGQLSLDVGGSMPDISSAKFRGISKEVEGEYQRGELLTFTVIARCSEVHFIDSVDEHGVVTKSERRHILRPESVRRIEPIEAEVVEPE